MRKETLQYWIKDDFPLRLVQTSMQEEVPCHCHDFFELVIFQRGTAMHSLYLDNNKKSFAVMQGDCFSILPTKYHSFELGNSALYTNIIFSPSLITPQLDELKLFDTWSLLFEEHSHIVHNKIHLALSDRLLIDNYLQRLKIELERKGQGYQLMCKSLLLEILLTILRNTPKEMVTTETPMQDSYDLLKIINLIEKEPEKNYSLSSMARNANMCVSNFTRKFRMLTGVSPIEYVISCKVEKAENLLVSTNLPIYAVAEACGFNNINYFIRTFKKFRHLTPAKFKKEQSKLSL